MIKTPPYLFPGSTIGLVCPSGYIPPDRMNTCVETLKEWGYNIKTGLTTNSVSDNYFSGSDEERLTDLQQMIDDPEIHAIMCARGGYGLTRIIDKIDFKHFCEHPKWLIGFSDVTILHSHVYTNYKISTIHGPMAGAFNDAESDNKYLLSLRNVMEGKKISYSCEPHTFNKKGAIIGELVGGNLSLLAHSIGTDSDIKTKGRILFLEDVGEYLYNTDRMFYQLKRAGKFDKLGGLIIGGFTGMKDTDRPFGKTIEEIISDVMSEYDFPMCFNFPVSHEKENLALKIGVGYKLKVSKTRVTLSE
ncbi:MAG: LD-carboxypeptidase [Flavitalea sp.]